MTLTAVRSRLASLQRVTGMTAATADLLVSLPAGSKRLTFIIMTIDAVAGNDPNLSFGPAQSPRQKNAPQKAHQHPFQRFHLTSCMLMSHGQLHLQLPASVKLKVNSAARVSRAVRSPPNFARF